MGLRGRVVPLFNLLRLWLWHGYIFSGYVKTTRRSTGSSTQLKGGLRRSSSLECNRRSNGWEIEEGQGGNL